MRKSQENQAKLATTDGTLNTGNESEQASRATLRQVHFYDVIPGQTQCWVHYISKVYEGADCRVLDVVRSMSELSAETLQALPNTLHSKYKRPSPALQKAFMEEAVGISLAGPTFLENVMTRSPFRNSETWIEVERAKFLQEHRARREAFASRH